eukprot:jgi/Bigna1/88387/estExt_fgenesh1_pg.C_310110
MNFIETATGESSAWIWVLVLSTMALVASKRGVSAAEAVMLWVLIDRETLEGLKDIKEEIARLRETLKTLSIAQDFVKYSKIQRKIAKLEKALKPYEKKVASCKMDWITAKVIEMLPLALLVLFARLFLGDLIIFTYQNGVIGGTIWTMICIRSTSKLWLWQASN